MIQDEQERKEFDEWFDKMRIQCFDSFVYQMRVRMVKDQHITLKLMLEAAYNYGKKRQQELPTNKKKGKKP